MNRNILFLAMLLCGGCTTTTFKQSAVDTLPAQLAPGKAVVVLDAAIWEVEKPLLLIIKNRTRVEKSFPVEDNLIEFTNYPGSDIPFYASKDPHRLHAYHINEGTYEIEGCVFEAPEVNRCNPGVWKKDGKPAGVPTFSVRAGEVVNLGKMKILYDGRTPIVTVEQNSEAATLYIKRQLPQFDAVLIHRPIEIRTQ